MFDEMSPDQHSRLTEASKTSSFFYDDIVADSLFTSEIKEKTAEQLSPWNEWHMMREHAMLALIPLLSTLSSAQAEWLVYASCINGTGITELQPLSPADLLWNEYQYENYWAQENFWHSRGLKSLLGASRLFACSLPENMIQAFCTFVLDERLAPSPDADDDEGERVQVAQRYLVRYSTENPESAHIVHSTIAAVLEKAIRLADLNAADTGKTLRLQSLGSRRVDLDFLNRGELARVVDVVLDCNAQSCISAIHKLYKNCNPNHSVARYGRQGLMAVYHIMGVGSKLKGEHVATASRSSTVTMRYTGSGQFAPVDGKSVEDTFVDELVKKRQTAVAMKESGETAVKVTKQVCACCGKSTRDAGRDLMRCGRCQLIKYCSRDCQKKDWKNHKRRCQAAS